MLYLQHHRAESDGWNISSQYYRCERDFQDDVRAFASFISPAAPCTCNVCRRQPLTLLASAANVVFKFVFNLERFQLTADTAHDLYAYGASSNRNCALNLLPPEDPKIRVWFRFDTSSHHSLHYGCPGRGSWNALHETVFESMADAITCLVWEKDTYWCSFCCKPFFFPDTCEVHPK
jgi:hypothetical protein